MFQVLLVIGSPVGCQGFGAGFREVGRGDAKTLLEFLEFVQITKAAMDGEGQ